MKNEALTPTEYRTSIYLDFEGEGKKKDGFIPQPHMAGLFTPNLKGKSGKYKSVFFLPSWKPVCNHFYNQAVIDDFVDYFDNLSNELSATKQYLVYWTIHESMILEKYLPKEIFGRLSPRLHNLHPIARRYANRTRAFGRSVSTKGKTLEEFSAALYLKRHPYPPFPLGAAEACRRLDTACAMHKKYKYFSDKQKGYTDELIRYNDGDCRSTWLIAKRLGNYFGSSR